MKWKLPFKIIANKDEAPKKQRDIAVIKKNMLSMASTLDILDDWLDLDEIEKIDSDATVISSVGIRKSATLKKQVDIKCADENISKELKKIITFTFRQQALDTPLQGIGIFELLWEQKNGLYYPTIIERNYQNFKFQSEKLFYIPDNIEVPKYKAIYEVYSPKFNKPMGRPLYKTLFWLVKFKNASVEFWIDFMERFSSPWIVGSTDGDKDEMATNLYAMLAGDVAVIEQEDTVELKTPGSKGNFQELSKYADDQIREALLGGNLTGNVEGGSYAASQTHNDIKEDIAMTDEHIFISLCEQIIAAFIEVNNYSKPITIELKDSEDIGKDRAERDLVIHQMSGGKLMPTKEYLESTYNIQLEEINTQVDDKPKANKMLTNRQKAIMLSEMLVDDVEKAASSLDTETIEDQIVDEVLKIFDGCESFDDAFKALSDKYQDISIDSMTPTLRNVLFQAGLLGAFKAGNE